MPKTPARTVGQSMIRMMDGVVQAVAQLARLSIHRRHGV